MNLTSPYLLLTRRIFIPTLIFCLTLCFSFLASAKSKVAMAFLISVPSPNEDQIRKNTGLKDQLNFPNLQSQAVIDLQRMERWLRDSGFGKDDIKLIQGDVTVKKITDAIIDGISGLSDGATILFYFTGHGLQINDKKGGPDIEPDHLDECIVLQNEVWVDDDISSFYRLHMSNFKNVMIMDACYMGTGYGIWGEPTIRELLITGSTKEFFDENEGKLSKNNCDQFSVVGKKMGFNMIYYGAAGDSQQAKADNDGSWLTRNIVLVTEDPNFKSQSNYQALYCGICSLASSNTDLHFWPEYGEIGDVQNYKSKVPLKLNTP